jgi:hypothetical protein
MKSIDFHRVKDQLQAFDFRRIFVDELGWSNPSRALRTATFTAAGVELERRPIAELAGFVVFEIATADGEVPDAKLRQAAHKVIGGHHHEHVLVFVDKMRQRSVWSWVHRKDGREYPRTHVYFSWQPGDLFIGKLGALMFDLGDFDEEGNVPIVEVARRVRTALDVETVTKRFFAAFEHQHVEFLALVEGIADERQRRWYVSVLLNRLMFIYFLQKKGFVDGRNFNYLQERLEWSKQNLGDDRYYPDFLKLLFFEGFAKPEEKRVPEARARLGKVRYLNGGLFLRHRIELDNPGIHIPDRAFEGLFALFQRYTWYLDDTPGGDDSAINPDVLGYIFEKYINQKSFGAYYTRPEITDWLCEQTIHRLVLQRVKPTESTDERARSEDLSELLLRLTPATCRDLLDRVLPGLSVLDPACGSGAFLVTAMKALLGIYTAVVGAAKTSNDAALKALIDAWEREHKSLGYFLKKRIITGNLYGVDLMEEATEIARLRLFLSLVSSASREEELEPLPNIDFNIMPGNSLVGLLHVEDAKFNRHSQGDLFAKSYRDLVDEKNRMVAKFRDTDDFDPGLTRLRERIEETETSARVRLNELLREDFKALGIGFEEMTWDSSTNDVGKPKKRTLRADDIQALEPFHWDYEMDEVLRARGGFDVILTNPPWDVYEAEDRHFIAERMDIGLMRNLPPEQFHAKRAEFLASKKNRKAYLEYLSEFPLSSAWFRNADEYEHQRASVDGKRAGGKLNLYKLFVERCYRLLRHGGHFGLVLPSGIYNDVGAKALRQLLFERCKVQQLFGFSNERYLFEGVHHSFKICLLVGQKGGKTREFEAAFRINPREAIGAKNIATFLRDPDQHVTLTPELIAQTSPDSLSITEFHDDVDIALCKKLLTCRPFGDDSSEGWNVQLAQGDINLTSNRELYKPLQKAKWRPLYVGKMIHQFDVEFRPPDNWVDWKKAEPIFRVARERRAREAINAAGAAMSEDRASSLSLDCSAYRLAYRDVARNTDERSMICAVLPPDVIAGHTLVLHRPWRDIVVRGRPREVPSLTAHELLFLVAVFNSFVADWFLRQRISAHVSMFFVYQLPVPRLTATDPKLVSVASRAARLVCVTPQFDALAKAAGIGDHKNGVTDPEQRAQLRAEIDGLVAHLYGLTEQEFQHVLRTFPVVPEPVRVAAYNTFRAVARGDLS